MENSIVKKWCFLPAVLVSLVLLAASPVKAESSPVTTTPATHNVQVAWWGGWGGWGWGFYPGWRAVGPWWSGCGCHHNCGVNSWGQPITFANTCRF